MVRVGGGWDTLEHFLMRHDPCQVRAFSRENTPPPLISKHNNNNINNNNINNNNNNDFLHIRAKYRSPMTERSTMAQRIELINKSTVKHSPRFT